jgi:hypothetical protein
MPTLRSRSLAVALVCPLAAPTLSQSLSLGAEIHVEGSDGISTVVADFDGDGRDDLAHSFLLNSETWLRVEVDDGTGGMMRHFEVPLWNESINLRVHLAAADFDGDGDVDLAAAMLFGWLQIYPNDGTGRFPSNLPAVLAWLGNITSIAAHDVDSDGAMDVVFGTLWSEFGLALGRGDGTFEAAQWLPAAYGGYDLTVVDLDGDGQNELVLAQGGLQRAVLLEFTAPGTFTALATLPLGVHVSDVLPEDVDADGLIDLVFAARGDHAVVTLRNLGGLSFAVVQQFTVGNGPARVAAGDLDGDGNVDLAVTEHNAGAVSTWLGNGDGTFRVGERYAIGTGPNELLAHDHDGDGDIDLLVAQARGGSQRLLRNRGDGTFVSTSELRLAVSGSPVHSLAVGDVDGDGLPDVIAINRMGGSVHVFSNQGAQQFAPPNVVTTGVRDGRLSLVDLDGDTHLDVLLGGLLSGGVVILYGRGDGTFEAPSLVPLGADSVLIAHGDFDGDGSLDLAATTPPPFHVTHTLHVLTQTAPRTFVAASSVSLGASIEVLDAVDVDVDGRIDLALSERLVTGLLWSRWRVLHGRGDGTFTVLAPERAEYAAVSSWPSDFDGDGRVDLLQATGLSLRVRPHLGRVTFVEGSLLRSRAYFEDYATVDADSDGRIDLLMTHRRDGTVGVMRGDGMGGFARPVTIGFGFEPREVQATDLDADGLPDLVGWETNTVNVLVRFNGVR